MAAPAIQLDDLRLKLQLRRALTVAGTNASQKLIGALKLAVNVSARAAPAGRRRRGQRTRIRYVASAPGEPPRKRTGVLQRAFAAETIIDLGPSGDVLIRVGNNARYARHLEYGTRKMAARPYLRTTWATFKGEFHRAMLDSLRRSLAA